MASPNDKLDADAQRAKTRGFGGYLKDKVTGSADFASEPKTKSVLANPSRKAGMDEAGNFKRGGVVKTKSRW